MLSVITVTVLGVSFVVLMVGLLWAIGNNKRHGDEFHKNLARRLQQLRLSRALRMFGVDPTRYLHSERVVDVERHMRNCAACEETERCETSLADGNRSAEGFGFCPNYDELQKRAEKAVTD